MAQTKQEIQALLARANSSPRHRFGQNFMIDQNLVRLVAEAGRVSAGEVVVEVGPGTGTLTEELLGRGAEVVAVEIDRELAGMLREKFAAIANFRLIEGDALAGKHGVNAELVGVLREGAARGKVAKLVANLPYNIASPLVIELLMEGVELLAFTVQKEVAERLRAKENTDEYGPLTVMAQMLGEVEVLRTLPPQAFWPAPKIDSSLVRVARRDRLGGEARGFSKFVHGVFSYRRKTLRKAMSEAGYGGEEVIRKVGVDPQVRPEVLGPGKLWELYVAVGQEGGGGGSATDGGAMAE